MDLDETSRKACNCPEERSLLNITKRNRVRNEEIREDWHKKTS